MKNITFKLIEDKNTWESFEKRFPFTTLFLSWQWRNFEESLGHTFLTYGMYEDNTLVGLLPLHVIKARRGSYLHARHSPLLDWTDQDLVKSALDFMIVVAKQHQCCLIRVSPLIFPDSPALQTITDFGFTSSLIHEVDAERSVYIDLTESEETILKNMRKTTRYEIKRAEKLGVTVKSVGHMDTELYADFEKIYLDTVARQNWTGHSLAYIKKQFQAFAADGKIRLFVAYLNGVAIASSIFSVHNRQVIYLHSGSLTEYRKIPSAYLLHWEAIKLFKKEGQTLYNFWGVSPENEPKHPWHGLSLFKRGFTGKERVFVHSHDYVVNLWGHILRLYEFLESKLRGY